MPSSTPWPPPFCVESDPEACHRSLVAERIGEQFGLSLSDLRP
jgi:hypothetical protein